MKKYNTEKALFSIHIPKTAGTSFQKTLKFWFGEDLYLHYFDEKNNKMPEKYVLKPGLCIHGHFNKRRRFGIFDYYPGANQFITIIRDPLELHLSNFFHVKNNIQSNKIYRSGLLQDFKWKNVDAYLDQSNSFLLSYFPWELTPDNFREILEKKFIHIGITENLQNSVNVLAEKMEKKSLTVESDNVSPRDEIPSPNAIERWKKRHKLEYLIYEYARTVNCLL